jgi:uncharacterized protein YbjT (DUF2867 family)
MFARLHVVLLGLFASMASLPASAVDADIVRELSKTHVLVAGATGRNGSAISAALLAAGAKPRLMTRDIAKAAAKFGADRDWVQADVTQPETLAAAFQGIDVVIDAVATSAMEGPNDSTAVDLEGTKHMIAAAKQAKVKRIVIITGNAVGSPPPSLPAAYAKGFANKREAEKLLIASGLEYVILRPTGILERPAGAWPIAVFAPKDYQLSPEDMNLLRASANQAPPAPDAPPPKGTIARADLAEVAIVSAVDRSARNRLFVITQSETRTDSNWRAKLEKMPRE